MIRLPVTRPFGVHLQSDGVVSFLLVFPIRSPRMAAMYCAPMFELWRSQLCKLQSAKLGDRKKSLDRKF